MNQYFAGQPTREDLQAIDQMRRQLVPMIGIMDKMRVDLERGNADWPTTQRFQSHINAYLKSIYQWLNGGYTHKQEVTTETARNDAGEPIFDSTTNEYLKEEKTIYIDTPVAGHARRLQALHPFPMAPFPTGNEQMAGLAQTLLRKRLEPGEEKWVEERLARAAGFAHVPEEWEVEPRKAEVKDEDEAANESNDAEGREKKQSTKRVPGTMTEDELMQLWDFAHRTVFDQEYQQTLFAEGEGEDEEEEDDEDGEDEDDGDAMDTSGAPIPVAAIATATAPAPKAKRARPELAPTGPPMLPLSFVHRFMASGEVLGAGGK
ncbi:hypothetical protein P153DRAFT_364800 [Dothidotthia symphoricarpi CBS 119687]|uniref:Mediator complex subunit 8 n=1 Tax=Dothidotthia symphoricarpi CBS 119687 TaxID=1392245 RepID=A0A6A6AMN5_9PLEO|nr:uncharacterized protein P153DRAFT_364800 [Dothidotthia symphoricarpi CBS 119687]KAF2132398.1 hypothetical protein P153DRAFT_364800 [Dothidotthia symphoricarpi CBS 119687]